MRRFLSAFILSMALVAPVTVKAEEHHVRRYYDRDARDWHEWNDREDRAYHRYWEERRLQHRNWEALKRQQQRDYWRWRHAHSEY